MLLSSSRANTEKKKILVEEFGVAMSDELEREYLLCATLVRALKPKAEKKAG